MPRLASCLALLPLAGSLVATPAEATEVEFEGAYRARVRLFDTLSLDRELDDSERLAMYAQHRLWLRPRFLLSDQVALNVDVKGLDNVVWGNRSIVPGSVVPGSAPTFQYDVTAPISDPSSPESDGTEALTDFTLWRAWGEVHTPAGKFRMGRIPLHWGSGVWMNDGLTRDPHFADNGDTADRFEWEYLVIDQFFIRAAVDVNAERFVNEVDDTTSFNLAMAYQTETVTAGAYAQVQHTVNGGEETGRFNLFSVDLTSAAELGKLKLETENVLQLGSGDLTEDLDQVNVAAFGSIVGAELNLQPWGLRVEGGLATGDGELSDQNLRTFTFDPDYSVGLILFEHPLPTLAEALGTAANQNRSYEQALTGTAVSNALYLKPSIRREIVEGFDLSAAWLGARTAKVPEAYGDRTSYGMEFQLGARYTGIEHFDAGLTVGTFLPGRYFENLPDDAYPAFTGAALGVQLSTRIHF